jgi:hypothetical protein
MLLAAKAQLDDRAGHQSMAAFHEDTAARDINDVDVVARSDTRIHEPVFFE